MVKKLLMCIILGMFMISLVSAVDWDNSLTYSEGDKKVKVENLFGLPIIGTDLAIIEITSHEDLSKPKLIYGLGYQEVMRIDGDGYEDYKDIIKGTEFINMKTDSIEELDYYWEKAISWETEDVDNNWIEICGEDVYTSINNSWAINCWLESNGTYEKQIVTKWERIDKFDITKGEHFEIRLIVWINRGDYYDGIPELFGKKVTGWASWTNPIGDYTGILYLEDGGTEKRGGRIMPKYDINITNITMDPYNTCTKAYIINGSNFAEINSVADIVSNVAHFGNFILKENTNYFIMVDAEGIVCNNKGNQTLDNIVRTNFNITSGSAGGGTDVNQYWWGIQNITSLTELIDISLTIEHPTATTYTVSQTELNYTITAGGTLDSCWYSLNLGDTNSTRQNCGVNWTGLSSAEGSNTWTVYGNDTIGTMGNTTVTFSIDSTAPSLNITYPNGTINYHSLGENLSLNWSITETNLDSCWYDFGGTNTTISNCYSNQTYINITEGSINSLILYANDTAGNRINKTSTWSYKLFRNSETYLTSLFEGVSTTFYANFLTNGSNIAVANLTYNNTEYVGSIANHGGNNFTVSKTIISPTVAASTNISFYWNIFQGAVNYTIIAKNQTVLNLLVDDCSTNTNVLYNFTMLDEETKATINGSLQNTSAKANMQIYGASTGTLIGSFNQSFNNTNPFAICLNSNLSNGGSIVHDLQVQYGASAYSTELYHIQNTSINSSNFLNNTKLYDLLTADTQVFKIIFRSSSFLPVENALIKIYRKYVNENTFRIVEIPKTDKRGETTAHLVLNNVVYNFQVVKYGVILETYNNVIAVCQTPLVSPCTIDLNAFAETITIPDYSTKDDFLFTLGYNETSNIITSIFSIPSGAIETVSLNISVEDALGTSACTDTLTSSSGTLSCTVPRSFGNTTVMATLYKGDTLQGKGNVKIGQNPIDIYGVNLAILALFIFLTLIGVGVSDNPIYTTIFIMVGVILLFALNLVANNGFIGTGATIIFLFIAVILVLIKGAKRN